MGGQNKSVLFVVNHIPDHDSRTKYQHGIALCDAFETTILCGETVPSEIRDTASSVRTFPESHLVGIPFGFSLWVFFWTIRLRTDSVVVSPSSLYVIVGFFATRVSRAKFVVDYWDDLTLPVAAYERQTGPRNRVIGLYHRIRTRLALVCLARVDVVVLSIHPGIIEKYDLGSVRIVELTNGFRPELLTYPRPTNAGEQIRFVYVGWATSLRGIDRVIRIVTEASEGKPIDIIGPTDDTVEHVAEQYDNVILHGEKPHSATLDLVARADIGLCVLDTSVENYQYSYPIKLFEYAALGKAIIASDTPAIRSILTDDESAILVGDNTEMEKAVTKLTADIQYQQRLGEQAQEEVRHYSWSEIRAQYTDAIQETMKA